MPFQITNYHSKEALSKAVTSGKKIFLHSIPLTKAQLQQNAAAIQANTVSPYLAGDPEPFHSYQISGPHNKQCPFYTCTVELGADCSVIAVI